MYSLALEDKAIQIQCPCGQIIKDYRDYLLLYLKKDMGEIDILCPNEYCYLRELGFLKFSFENDQIKFERGRFYAPYVTWNSTRMNEEETIKILKQHLIDITEKNVTWGKIKQGLMSKKSGDKL